VFGFAVTPGVEMDRDDLPTRIHTAPNSRWLLASLYRVKATGTDWYVAPLIEPLTRPPAWSLLATARDALSAPQLRGDTLYALSHAKDDRGTIVRRVMGAPADRPWDTVVPPSEGVIVAFTVQRDGVYYTERKNGRIALRRWRHGDAAASEITVPSGGTVRLVRGQPQEQGVTFYSESWASPPHWQRVATVNGAIAPLPIDDGSRAAVVDELTSTSRVYASVDGTKVPVSVVYSSRALRNGVLDGTAPLLIEAYGAFGRATDPAFNPFAKVWTSLGGVYAYAHVRGGGELGEAWHRAATREHKQRTFDDMIAVIEGLIGEQYTAAGRVTLMGISFGANIPGMLLVQRPDLLGTALFEVGQPDEIRGAYFDPTAARNIGELGDLETREGIQLLRQASPYHQVPDSVRLPAVIVHSATGDYNFGSGMLAGKYVARLQAANRGRRPVLWVQTDGGHRSLLGLSPAWAAKALSFSLWQAGMAPYQPRADSSVAGLPDRDPPE
jgi:prolyl oligopeptidase